LEPRKWAANENVNSAEEFACAMMFNWQKQIEGWTARQFDAGGVHDCRFTPLNSASHPMIVASAAHRSPNLSQTQIFDPESHGDTFPN
jgi:hypothetical protein